MDPAAISTTIDPTAPPPEPPKPSRSSFSCDRHPAEQFTGFCPTCLCERLNTLENSSINDDTPSSSRRPSSVTAALKNLFSAAAKPPKPSKRQPTTLSPKLRRTKSFSASNKNEALPASSFEPQRKSCDVRARSTRWSIFAAESSSRAVNNGVKVESFAANDLVSEEIEDDDDFKDAVCLQSTNDDDDDVIRPVIENPTAEASRNNANTSEIVEEEAAAADVADLKPMKDHIDIDVREKKYSSGGVGGFLAAASVFSKKLHKWRQKQKKMKHQQPNGVVKLTKSPLEKPIIPRRRREAHFQIPDYNGLGRRSCDTDPRFSIDTGRISFDDPRFSFEKPRASWDGHFAAKNFPRIAERAPPPPRFDLQIPVEECTDEDDSVPGGLLQTRDYYQDSSSSSSKRKSLDRSSSVRKAAAAEISSNSASGISTAKIESFLAGEIDSKNSNSNPTRPDCPETGSGLSGGDVNFSINSSERKESKKPKNSFGWKIWGFIYRRISGSSKEIEANAGDEKYIKANGVQRSLSESWQEIRRDGFENGFTRSNSSVSWRNGAPGIIKGKNRSGRFSPNRFENNGLLRLYLAPMRGGQRGGGLGNIRASGSLRL